MCCHSPKICSLDESLPGNSPQVGTELRIVRDANFCSDGCRLCVKADSTEQNDSRDDWIIGQAHSSPATYPKTTDHYSTYSEVTHKVSLSVKYLFERNNWFAN